MPNPISSGFNEVVKVGHRGRRVVPDKYRGKWFVFSIILAALCLDNLNISGGVSLLLSVAERTGASSATASWMVSAYALTLGSFIILFGKLADIVGVHRVFLCGLGTMALFSLLTAVVENNIIALIIFRAFQGIGGAALLPSGYALTGNYFQGKEREKALRPFSHSLTASFGIGFVIAGALSESKIGYKGFFYFTFAMSSLTLIILYFIIIPVPKTEGHKNLKVKNLNFAGVFLLVVGLLLIIFGLTEAGEKWDSPKVYIPLPIGFLLMVLVFIFEDFYLTRYKKKHSNKILPPGQSEGRSGNQPHHDWRLHMDLLFPLEIFKIVNFFPLFFGLFWLFFAFIGILTTLIQYYEYVCYDSPLMAGVKLLPHTAGLLFSSFIYREGYVRKFGAKNFLIFSGVLSVGSAVWMSRLDYRVTNEYWKFHFAGLFIAGYACNLYFMVYVNTIMSQTPLHFHGLVTGIFQTGAQIGVCIASAIIATLLGKLEFYKSDSRERYDLYKRFQNCMYLVVAAQATFFIMMFLVKSTPIKAVDQEKQDPEHAENREEIAMHEAGAV